MNKFIFGFLLITILSGCERNTEAHSAVSEAAKATAQTMSEKAANEYDAATAAQDAAAEASAAAMIAAEANTDAAASKKQGSPTTSGWEYSEEKDEMRGVTRSHARLKSLNQIYFNMPYDGGSNLFINIRKNHNNTMDVMFYVDKGQFICASYDGCKASIKFGNKTIREVSLSGPADYSSDLLFISNKSAASQFIESLKKEKTLIIELEFYQAGRQQFKFNVSGLKWGI